MLIMAAPKNSIRLVKNGSIRASNPYLTEVDDHNIRLLIVGDKETGKSTILKTFVRYHQQLMKERQKETLLEAQPQVDEGGYQIIYKF